MSFRDFGLQFRFWGLGGGEVAIRYGAKHPKPEYLNPEKKWLNLAKCLLVEVLHGLWNRQKLLQDCHS